MKTLETIIRRVFFYGAFILGIVAACEKIANVFRVSFLKPYYTPRDLLELAAIALIFAIAMQLHQIRLLLSSRPTDQKK